MEVKNIPKLCKFDKILIQQESDRYTDIKTISSDDIGLMMRVRKHDEGIHYMGKTSNGDQYFIDRDRDGIVYRNGEALFTIDEEPEIAYFTIINDRIIILFFSESRVYDANGILLKQTDIGVYGDPSSIHVGDNIIAWNIEGHWISVDSELNTASLSSDGYIVAYSKTRYAKFCKYTFTLFDGTTHKKIWQRNETITPHVDSGVIIGDTVLFADYNEVYKLTATSREKIDLHSSNIRCRIIKIFADDNIIVFTDHDTVVVDHALKLLFTIPNFTCRGLVGNYLYNDENIYDIYERRFIDGIRSPSVARIKILDCESTPQSQIRDTLREYIDWPPNVLSVVAYYL